MKEVHFVILYNPNRYRVTENMAAPQPALNPEEEVTQVST